MTVTGAAINSSVTEGTGSYTTSQSSYGKGQMLRELPQTVTAMTYERIQDQGLKTLDDVMIYTPGVTVLKESTGNSLFYSRGFLMTSFQIDGNSPLLYNADGYGFGLNTSQPDLAMFDHIEVLRGSDALYGTSGEPGGAINLIRKKPTKQFQMKALAHAGSWHNYRGELDVGGSIMADGRIRGRLVGVYENRKYFYDVANSDKYLFYGIVEADITDSTLLTLGGDFTREDSTHWRFGLPRSTFFGTKDDRWLRKNNKQFVRIDQAIGTDWTLGIEASRAQSKVAQRDFLWYGAIDPITFSGLTSLAGQGFLNDRSETQNTLDAVLKGAFHLLGREHKVIFGANINRYKNYTDGYGRSGSSIQVPNIFEFNPANYLASSRKRPPPGTSLAPVTGRSYEVGVKGNLFDGRLNTALAFYSIKRKGQAVRDQAYPPTSGDLGSSCCYLDDGRIISKGIDIEVSGEIVNGWQIQAGYTFNDNENKAESGRYSTTTPKHLFKLWSSYELRGIVDGLKLGGGLTAQSSNYQKGSARTFNQTTGLYDGPSIDYEFTQSGYVLVDLFAQYQFNKHWSATANINNIFDKKYYQNVGVTNSSNWYGTPRNFLLTMRYSY